MLSFVLLRAHLFLGSFLAFGYLRPITGLFCLWAKFSPWLQSARLWPVNTLGRFHSVIKIRPINGGHLEILIGGRLHDILRASQGPFILGIISSTRLLTTRYCHFLLVGQIQPVVTVGPFVAR